MSAGQLRARLDRVIHHRKLLPEEDDPDHDRLSELALKQFEAEVLRRDPLTDDEVRELADLRMRFPPDPEVAEAFKPFSEALRKLRE